MAIYMIDYENVKTGGLNGISRLTAEDRVIIFYSENANRLTFDLHRRLMECPAQIEYREVTVGGHNALDFQLVTYLGYLIAQNPTGQYLIISYDRGFEYVVNFWRKDGLCIGLLPYLKDPSYALSKVVRGEYISGCGSDKAPKQEEAVVEFVSDEEEEAEEPIQQAVEELPAEEVAAQEAAVEEAVVEEVAVEETPAEETVAEEPVAEEVPVAKETVESPVEETPVEEAPTETAPVAETPAPKNEKKKSSPKKAAKPAEKKDPPKKAAEPPKEKEEKKSDEKPSRSLPSAAELKSILGDLVVDDPEVRFVRTALNKYKTKLGLNNGLVKHFGNQRAGEIYQKVKPFMDQKKER